MQNSEQLKKELLRGSIADRQLQFKQLLRSIDPMAETSSKDGYLFYRAPNALFTVKERIIDEPDSDFHGDDFDDFEGVQIGLANQLLSGTLEQRRSAKKILASEYKIHLMPKPEYILAVTQKIIQAASKDPKLARLISQIKIREKPEESAAEIFPNIVIYPKLGRSSATRLISKLYKLFLNCDLSEIAEGSDHIPRRSVHINNLIYYAQGGSDIKKAIIQGLRGIGKLQEKSEYLTERERHFAGERPLDLEEIRKAAIEEEQKSIEERKDIRDQSERKNRRERGEGKVIRERSEGRDMRERRERKDKAETKESAESQYFHNPGNYAIVKQIEIHSDHSVSFTLKNDYPGRTQDLKGRESDRTLFHNRRADCEEILRDYGGRLVKKQDSGTTFKVNNPRQVQKILGILEDQEKEEPYHSGFMSKISKEYDEMLDRRPRRPRT